MFIYFLHSWLLSVETIGLITQIPVVRLQEPQVCHANPKRSWFSDQLCALRSFVARILTKLSINIHHLVDPHLVIAMCPSYYQSLGPLGDLGIWINSGRATEPCTFRKRSRQTWAKARNASSRSIGWCPVPMVCDAFLPHQIFKWPIKQGCVCVCAYLNNNMYYIIVLIYI